MRKYKDLTAGSMMKAAGTSESQESQTIEFRNGTFVDVLFGSLNLNNGASAHFANEVQQRLAIAGNEENTVNLVGHGGGVQVVMGASSYLGDIGSAVDHLVGAQEPTLGRFNNANSITLIGSATIGASFDFVSGLGRIGAPFVSGII